MPLHEKDHKRDMFLMFLLSLSGIHMAYFMSIFNPLAIPLLQGYYHVGEDIEEQSGNVMMYFALGATVSVAFLGKLADYFGRVKVLLATEFLAAAACLLYLVPGVGLLMFTRFISGLAGGINNPISGILLVEKLPKKLGEEGNMIIFISSASGLLIAYAMPLFVSRESMTVYWRYILGWPLTVHAVRFALLFYSLWGRDTPKFVAVKYGQKEDVKNRVKASLLDVYEDEALDDVIDEVISQNSESAKSDHGGINPNTVKGLFSPLYLHKMISGLIGNLGQQITGIGFLIYFSTQLFDEISGNGTLMTLVIGIAYLAGGFLGVGVIAKYSELNIMEYGCYIQSLSMFGLVLCMKWKLFFALPLLLVTFMISYAISMGATMNLYVNEILPPMGVSIAVAASWVASGLVGKVSPLLLPILGASNMLVFYGFCCAFVGFIIGRCCYDNTSDREKEAARELAESAAKTEAKKALDSPL